MASKTRATELKRIRRDKRNGRKRKNALENHGSTKKSAELFGDAKN